MMLNGNPHDFCSSNPSQLAFQRILQTLSLLVLAWLPCPGTANAAVLQALPLTQGSEVSTLMEVLETQLRHKQSTAAQQSAQQLANLLSPRDPRFFQLASLCAIHENYTTATPLWSGCAAFPRSYDVNYNLSPAYLRNKNYAKAADCLPANLGWGISSAQPARDELFSRDGNFSLFCSEMRRKLADWVPPASDPETQFLVARIPVSKAGTR